MAQIWIGSVRSPDRMAEDFQRARSRLALHLAGRVGLEARMVDDGLVQGALITGPAPQVRRLLTMLYVYGAGRVVAVADDPSEAALLRSHPAVDTVHVDPPRPSRRRWDFETG